MSIAALSPGYTVLNRADPACILTIENALQDYFSLVIQGNSSLILCGVGLVLWEADTSTDLGVQEMPVGDKGKRRHE